ncbi:glycosyltransferase family 4 protein, partial [candidate division WOR-3 bacterium]|nr:glycosyltransferase family 4 protein [candidate division WOR-3 bacterium]
RAGYRWYVGASFRFFDKKTIVVQGQWLNDMLAKRHRRKGIVINPGVDTKIFYPRGPQKRDRRIITHIAHSGYWKGLSDTIEAIRYVYKECKNIELVTLTRIPDYKPCGDFPERVIRNANSDEIAEQHSSASLFVSSSIFEGCPLSPLEAMACGLPCVLTRSTGIDDYAVDRYNCILVPPKNPEALAKGILSVLRDKDLAKKIGKDGLETAKRFTWEKMVDKFEKVLKNVSENRKDIC